MSGSYSVGSIGAALICCFARGPWETRWLGWRGGWDPRKRSATSVDGKTEEKILHGPKENLQTFDLEKGRKQEEVNQNADAENGVELLAAEDGKNPLREIRDHEAERNADDGRKEGEEEITTVRSG